MPAAFGAFFGTVFFALVRELGGRTVLVIGFTFTRCQFLIELVHRMSLVSKISVVIRSGSGMLNTFAGLFHVLDLREATCNTDLFPDFICVSHFMRGHILLGIDNQKQSSLG